jgi:hypothetical protein
VQHPGGRAKYVIIFQAWGIFGFGIDGLPVRQDNGYLKWILCPALIYLSPSFYLVAFI